MAAHNLTTETLQVMDQALVNANQLMGWRHDSGIDRTTELAKTVLELITALEAARNDLYDVHARLHELGVPREPAGPPAEIVPPRGS